MTGQQQRKTVIDANRCLNCLSRGHLARNCNQISKCRQCGPNSRNKHATALHEACAADAPTLGAASGGQNASVPAHNEDGAQSDHPGGLTTRKVTGLDCSVSNQHVVLLRTSAVRVRNPNSGKSTLAYAQHDTASQATLITQTLCEKLKLETETDSTATLRTLGDQTAVTKGRTNFELKSLSTGEKFP